MSEITINTNKQPTMRFWPDKLTRDKLWKQFSYEAIFIWRSFSLSSLIAFLLSLFCAIAMTFNDTEAFVRAFPLPTWLQMHPKIVSGISVTIIVIAAWIGYQRRKTHNADYYRIIREALIPYINSHLEQLRARIMRTYKLSDSARLSIFLPVRDGIFQWGLRMICQTNNVPQKEKRCVFTLDEGIVGMVFLRTKKNNVMFVDITDKNNTSYRPLSDDNRVLIKHDLKGILVTCVVQGGTVAGLLSLDSSNASDLQTFQSQSLHESMLDWICENDNSVQSLWRMSNYQKQDRE